MSSAPQSEGRHSSPSALRALFERFTDEIAADKRTPIRFTVWSDARDRWRAQWNSRQAASPELMFRLLVPGPASRGRDQWTHPVAEQAPELDSWNRLWHEAAPGEQNELAATFVRVIAQIETDAASLGDACGQLARLAGDRGLPFAALTPALSALDPTRYVVLCDAWLRTLEQYEGTVPPKDVGGYPEFNAKALRWLATAEGESPAPVLTGRPHADRLGLFCDWIVRTNPGAAAGARFDVTQKKYKDWPPMW